MATYGRTVPIQAEDGQIVVAEVEDKIEVTIEDLSAITSVLLNYSQLAQLVQVLTAKLMRPPRY